MLELLEGDARGGGSKSLMSIFGFLLCHSQKKNGRQFLVGIAALTAFLRAFPVD
jgi:hypothetical protein